MDYKKAEDYLYSLPRLGLEHGQEKIQELLNKWENPERELKFVQVAGTNGKGSTTTMIASILSANGLRAGRYVSPHLDCLTERIQVNGKSISKTALAKLVERARELGHECTFFELMTAIALRYFKEQRVDYAVLEVGLGGRLDATTLVNPSVCVITSIDFDHTELLGDTLAQIAREKAGIIKPGCTVVTAERKPEALAVIKKVCEEKGARLVQVEKGNYKLAMLGEFQQWNASCAVEAVKALKLERVDPTKGLSEAIIPGRMELRGNVLMDVGHNPACMRVLAQAIEGLGYDKLFIVFGAKEDKNTKEMLRILPEPDELIITEYRIAPHALPVGELARQAKELGLAAKITVIPKVLDAVAYAKRVATKKDLVVVTGSTFTVSEVRGQKRQICS